MGVVRVTPRLLYNCEKWPGTHWTRGLVRSSGTSGRFGQEVNPLPLSGIEPRFLGRLARGVVTILTELSRLCEFTLRLYRVYTKEWCGFNSLHYWNRTIRLCIPCISHITQLLQDTMIYDGRQKSILFHDFCRSITKAIRLRNGVA